MELIAQNIGNFWSEDNPEYQESIELPEKGTYILEGRNTTGKTTILKAFLSAKFGVEYSGLPSVQRRGMYGEIKLITDEGTIEYERKNDGSWGIKRRLRGTGSYEKVEKDFGYEIYDEDVCQERNCPLCREMKWFESYREKFGKSPYQVLRKVAEKVYDVRYGREKLEKLIERVNDRAESFEIIYEVSEEILKPIQTKEIQYEDRQKAESEFYYILEDIMRESFHKDQKPLCIVCEDVTNDDKRMFLERCKQMNPEYAVALEGNSLWWRNQEKMEGLTGITGIAETVYLEGSSDTELQFSKVEE